MMWDRWWISWAVAVIANVILLFLLNMVLWTAIAKGGCNIPPPTDPMTDRRNAICAALKRPPECEFRERRTVGGHVEATETDFLLYIEGAFIGQFPILNGVEFAPEDLNTDLVRRALRYRMGDAEVQQRAKRAVRGRVAWIADVLDWQLNRADVVIAVGP